MRRIILHIGPEKCGSTSIQAALGADGPLAGVLTGVVLDPYAVHALGSDPPAPALLDSFRTVIRQAQAAGRPVVLSHEMIFKSLPILTALTRLAQKEADEVIAVAYVRPQSDFLVSAFGQWHFRSAERLAEAADILRRAGLDPELFWAVERHVIAATLEGWSVGRQPSGHLYLDWAESVPERARALERLGVRLSLGCLPGRGHGGPLVADFAGRCGIGEVAELAGLPPANPAYHPLLIEATAAAILAGQDMPAPGEGNDFFKASSSAALGPAPDMPFLDRLKAHVDTAFAPGNRQLAADHGLPPGRFAPAECIDRASILSAIAEEARRRAAQPADLRQREALARAALAGLAWRWYPKRR